MSIDLEVSSQRCLGGAVILAAALLAAGCGGASADPAGGQGNAAGNEKEAAAGLPATDAARPPSEWPAAYAAVLKQAEARHIPQFADLQDWHFWLIRLPSPAERELLMQISSRPAEDRLAIMQAFVEAAAKGEVQPVEYVVHAAVGDNAALRDRVVEEVLKPGWAAASINDARRLALVRVAIELEAADRVPGMTTKAVEMLAGALPKLSADPKNRPDMAIGMKLTVLARVLASMAAKAPEAERFPVLASLSGQRPSEPSPADGMPKLTEAQFQDSIQHALQAAMNPRSAPPRLDPDAAVKPLRDNPQLAGPELLRIASSPGFSLKRLTVEERQTVVPRIAQALQATSDPGQFRSVTLRLTEAGTELSVADRLAILSRAEKEASGGRFSDRHEQIEIALELVRCAPPEQATVLVQAFAEQRAAGLLALLPRELAAKVPRADGQTAIRALLSRLPAGDFTVLEPVVVIGDSLPEADREKLHQFLIAKMQAIGSPEMLQGPERRARLEFIAALARSSHLNAARAEELWRLKASLPAPPRPSPPGQQPPPEFREWRFTNWESASFVETDTSLLRKAPRHVLDAEVAKLTGYLAAAAARAPGEAGPLLTSEGRPVSLGYYGELLAALSADLSPQQAEQAFGPLAARLEQDFEQHRATPRFVQTFIAARPPAERGRQIEELGKAILLGRFRTLNAPADNSDGFALIRAACKDLPPEDASRTLLAAIDQLLAGSEDQDPADSLLLVQIASRVPTADQPAAGKAIVQKLEGAKASRHKLSRLVRCLNTMPQSLSEAERTTAVKLLVAQMIADLKAITGRTGLANTFDQESNVQGLALLLVELAAPLPPETARPIAASLVDVLPTLTDRLDWRKGVTNPPGRDQVGSVVKVLGSLAGECSPAELKQVAESYMRFLLFTHPVGAQKSLTDAEKIKGTLPPGTGLILLQEIVAVSRRNGGGVEAEGASALRWVAERLAPNDAVKVLAELEKLAQPQRDRTGGPPRPGTRVAPRAAASLAAAVNRCSARLPAAEAAAKVDALAAAIGKEPDAGRKQELQQTLLAALEPLAADPDKYWDRVQSLGPALSDNQRYQALGFLARTGDPQSLRSVLDKALAAPPTQTNPPPAPSAPQQAAQTQAAQSMLLGSILAPVPYGERLAVLDALAQSTPSLPAESILVAADYVAQLNRQASPPPRDEVVAMLRVPDCVGGRRVLALLSSARTRSPMQALGVWGVFQTPPAAEVLDTSAGPQNPGG